MINTERVAIVGGCGRVGLPLATAFANAGHEVDIYDTNAEAVLLVNEAHAPFFETGLETALAIAIESGRLSAYTEPDVLALADVVVVVIGTPVNGHLAPDPQSVPDAVSALSTHLRTGQLLVLRSTVYPGVTDLVARRLDQTELSLDIAFCPERISEGQALVELANLPQIVSGLSERAVDRSRNLFRSLTEDILVLSPREAELAKLFTNAWRYIKFAAANQLFMIANDEGVSYERIRGAMSYKYPRAADIPGAGFAAGPCLFKDTAQLSSVYNNAFTLGHSAMMINEGLPGYVVKRMEQRWDLSSMTVGVLGMAFKAGSDDTRSSLSFKVERLLRSKAARVMCTDPYVTDDRYFFLEDVLEACDVLVIGAPHDEYRSLNIEKPIVDIWSISESGGPV